VLKEDGDGTPTFILKAGSHEAREFPADSSQTRTDKNVRPPELLLLEAG